MYRHNDAGDKLESHPIEHADRGSSEVTTIFATAALLPAGLARDVAIEIAGDRILRVLPNATAVEADEWHDLVIPGVGNLHSHAFQRAMAGLAERRGASEDSFWSWRTAMYRFALSMTPDDVQAVASQLYVEMLEAGFTRVGEFHYLHHDLDGNPYANIAEMAERIAEASSESGIGLTLIPVFYAHAGFGDAPPLEGQRRFINTPDRFERLMSSSRAAVRDVPGAIVGMAPHSLRAASIDEILATLPLAGSSPIHIHISEQIREVEECIAATGRRPVQYLLESVPVTDRWCLIHATHLTDDEVEGIAAQHAVVGLCPITEANLGDGIFPGRKFVEQGGHYGVGSDSNVDVSLSGELKQLEYSQRLGDRARNVIAAIGGSTGERLLSLASEGGARALGVSGGLAAGRPADFVSLRADPYLPVENWIDSFVFAKGMKIRDVWANGQKQVVDGKHKHSEGVRARFQATMRRLLSA